MGSPILKFYTGGSTERFVVHVTPLLFQIPEITRRSQGTKIKFIHQFSTYNMSLWDMFSTYIMAILDMAFPFFFVAKNEVSIPLSFDDLSCLLNVPSEHFVGSLRLELFCGFSAERFVSFPTPNVTWPGITTYATKPISFEILGIYWEVSLSSNNNNLLPNLTNNEKQPHSDSSCFIFFRLQ